MPKNIENLTVHGFRGLRELELRELGRINLLVGPNNCGKTSVLEAIATFCRPLDIREWFGAARRREIKSSREPLYEAVHWIFPRTDRTPSGELFYGETNISSTGGRFEVLAVKAVCEEMLAEEEESSSESSDGEIYSESLSGSGLRHVTELRLAATLLPTCWLEFGTDPQTHTLAHEFSIWHDQPFTSRAPAAQPALNVATVSPFAHRVEQVQIRQLTALTLAESKGKTLEVLRMFDEGVTDLEILSREGIRPAIYVVHEHLGRAPLSAFGDGMRRALVIAMNLVSAEHGVLLIDEVEASIHTSVLESLFEWLAKACAECDVQLFATTHSLEAVDAMLLGGKIDLNEVVGYHLEALPKKTAARRYSGDLLRRLREERGLDVR